jgi:RimJ/RimL family protein N-acetyltransferase
MIRGNTVGLRARHESDVAVLQAELYDDVETRSRADNRPWQPIAPDSSHSPYAVADPSDDAACFSVVLLDGGELVGEALLWAVDTHNRSAHIGISLRPAYRGRGIGTETVRVLCHYGFVVRGLHRMQIETLAGNTAMIRAAARAGFELEGTLRGSSWAGGAFSDEVILGRLAAETASETPGGSAKETTSRAD